MNRSTLAVGIATVLLSFAAGSWVLGAGKPGVPAMIVLTGDASDAGYSDEFIERRNKERERLLRNIGKNRREMVKNGFIVVSDARALEAELLFGEVLSYELGNREANALIPSRIGYVPIDAGSLAGDAGVLVGRMPAPSDDGSIHRMFYAFEFEGIGQVVIEELSFATIRNETIRVTEPAGNVTINGMPGTYLLAVNEVGSKAISSLDFLTESKSFTLLTSARLDVGSDGYKALISVAEALH